MSDSTQVVPTTVSIPVTQQFALAIPQEPSMTPAVATLSALAPVEAKRDELVCQRLLIGDTLSLARQEAAEVLPRMLASTAELMAFGTPALKDVNALGDQMISDRPPASIPQELQNALKQLSRDMRSVGKKYDPNDPKVLERYERVKGGLLSRIGIGKTFFEEFMDDVRSLEDQFDKITETMEGKQYALLKNVAYYDDFYQRNGTEIDKLIYVIGVMEIIRDMLNEQASQVAVGNSNLGDRGGEEQARILELVTHLDNKITAFKGRLWVAWAMTPQIRNMRAVSLGLSVRINQTVDITIPTMKNTIGLWLTLSEAQQAEEFNKAVEAMHNQSLVLFAHAAKATVAEIAAATETPALSPQTVAEMTASLVSQADAFITAHEAGEKMRAELDRAIIEGKEAIDAATQRVNQAKLERSIARATAAPLQIAHSVPASS